MAKPTLTVIERPQEHAPAPVVTVYRRFDAIKPNRWNKRRWHLDDAKDPEIVDLAASMERHRENFQAILIRPLPNGDEEIIYGERRQRAARLSATTKKAPWRSKGTDPVEMVKCELREISDEVAFEMCMEENKRRKNLSPLEEADSLQVYMEEKHWTLDQAATQMGMSRQTAARRLQLSKLSPRWQEMIVEAAWPMAKWSTAHFEKIATFPAEVQDDIMDRLWDSEQQDEYEEVQGNGGYIYEFQEVASMDLSELRRYLSGRFTLLENLPWPMDDVSLNGIACQGCQQRSDANPDLFDAEDYGGNGKAKAGAQCLNRTCFMQKHTAIQTHKVEALRAKHPDLVLLQAHCRGAAGSPWEDANLPQANQFAKVKKKEQGATPALVVGERFSGEIFYVRQHNGAAVTPTATSSGARIPNPPKPLKERRADLEKARRKLVYGYLIQDVEQWCKKEEPPRPTCGILAFAVVFGTHTGGTSTGYPHHPRLPSNRFSWDLAEDLGNEGEGELLLKLYLDALGNLRTRWHQVLMANYIEEKTYKTEVEGFCRLLSLDRLTYEDRACLERPEPKGWAKLNADGSPKAAPAKGKPAKADTKKPKREPKAAASETEASEEGTLEAEREARLALVIEAVAATGNITAPPSTLPKWKAPKEAVPGECYVCGCQDDAACENPIDGDPCHWVDKKNTLCSACVQDAFLRLEDRREAGEDIAAAR